MSNSLQKTEQHYIWDPFQLFRDYYTGAMSPRAAHGMFVPDFEVKERDHDYLLQADVPGIEDEDLDITVSSNRLTVAGRREAVDSNENERYVTCERRYGSFSRTFALPADASTEDIEAKLDKGVLTVIVRKTTESQPRKISLEERVRKALKV